MRKKIVVLGANGMAGHVIYNYLITKNEHEIIPCVRESKYRDNDYILDVTSISEVSKMLKLLKPDIIINAIGVLIKGSKMNSSNAIYINSFLPHKLSELSKEIKSKVIHLSTDCVFNGNDKGGYTESSFTDAEDIYGKSKALGEIVEGDDITIRTSIIGPELKRNGEGLLHWYLKSEGNVKGFSKAFWSGITTLELAKVIDVVISKDVKGLCHVTNNEKISKFDLLVFCKEIWNKKGEVFKDSTFSKDKSFVDTKHKIEIEIPSYKKMLLDLKELMSNNEHLYTQYFQK